MTSTSVVVDLTQDDSAASLQIAQRAMQGELTPFAASWVFIVQDNGRLSAELGKADCTLVTVNAGPASRVNDWSAGVQVVVGGDVLFVPSAEACLALQAGDGELLERASVAIAYEPHDPGHPAEVRLVAFTVEAYAAVRGFHLGVREPRRCLIDLVTRIVWATGESATHVNLPDEPDGEFVAPRGVIANLPIWRFRPPSAPPLVSVIVLVTDGFEPDALSSIKAQGFDDVEIVVVDTQQSSEVREWVVANQRDYLRFGLRDTTTYLASGNTSHENEAALALCRGRYLLFMNARDLLLPWALETCLRRFKAGTSAIAGPRVHFDQTTGDISPVAEPYVNSVALVERDTAINLLTHGHPTAQEFGSWSFMRPLLGGVEHTSIAFALNSGATARPARSVTWKAANPRGDVRALAAPYLPDTVTERFLVFRRYCVGKVDEIGAYSRLVGTLTCFSSEGVATDEIAVVSDASYGDMARLSRANIPYEVVAQTSDAQSHRYINQALQEKLSDRLDDLAEDQVMRIESVDAVGGGSSGESGDPLGWVSYKPSHMPPLNLALSAQDAAATAHDSTQDGSVTYWSRVDLEREEVEHV